MEIQTKPRMFDRPKNLVLYVHIQANPGGAGAEFGIGSQHVAILYEADTIKAFGQDEELPPALFYGAGIGYKEWQATLAFVDILLARYDSSSCGRFLESWLLKGEVGGARARWIYLQVRHQGRNSDLRFESLRIQTREPSSLVPVFIAHPSEVLYT